jgi:hypothetical protein
MREKRLDSPCHRVSFDTDGSSLSDWLVDGYRMRGEGHDGPPSDLDDKMSPGLVKGSDLSDVGDRLLGATLSSDDQHQWRLIDQLVDFEQPKSDAGKPLLVRREPVNPTAVSPQMESKL